jgi:hypothetical protein
MSTGEQTPLDAGFVTEAAIFGGLPEHALCLILAVARVV